MKEREEAKSIWANIQSTLYMVAVFALLVRILITPFLMSTPARTDGVPSWVTRHVHCEQTGNNQPLLVKPAKKPRSASKIVFGP